MEQRSQYQLLSAKSNRQINVVVILVGQASTYSKQIKESP